MGGNKYNAHLENLEIRLLTEGLSQHYAIDFQDAAGAPLRRKIWEAVRKERVKTISGLQEKLLHDAPAMDRFMASITPAFTPYSPEFYLKFRNEIIPLLRTYPFIRIWQVGCSSLKEVYGMAIILIEEGLSEKSTIYATDVNESILQRAENGMFALNRVQEHKNHYLGAGGKGSFETFFTGGGKSGLYDPGLKKNMVFAQHNLATDASFNEFNAVLCRTSLHAMQESTRQRAHEVLYESLGMFGVLGLGDHETLEGTLREACYTPLDPQYNLYRKTR